MPDKLRIGIIGAGGIARHAHILGYKAVLDMVELVAVADVDAERAKIVAAEDGFQHSYASYETMLANEDLDIVSVCTPNKFHAPATIAALEAGCNVLCEKPPAMTTAEVRSMVETAEKAGKILSFGLNSRYAAAVEACKRFVDAGELGHIYAGRVKAIRRRGIPGWGVFTNKELQGGGPLIDVGVHMLDVALYMMGYPAPKEILGVTFQKLGNRPGVGAMGAWDWQHFEVEDLAMAMIKFHNGASLLLETSFAANIEPMEEMSVSLSGTEGGAYVSQTDVKLFKEMHDTLVDLTPAWLPKKNKMHVEEVRDFVRTCRDGDEPMVKGIEAIRLQEIIEGIYTSAVLDRTVTLDA